MKLINVRLSGDVFFRDFLIDTTLIPLVFDGKLLIKSRETDLMEMPIEMLLSGGVMDLEIVEKYKPRENALLFDVSIEKFRYSDEQLQEFLKIANTINSYYSYSEALRLILEQYGNSQLSRENASSSTFIAWHHINRVINFTETYAFKEELNLVSNDPKRYLEMLERVKRLEKRSSTLFTKELQKGRKGKLLDRNEYGIKYANISKYYIQLSKQYQPNNVSAFNELVRIFPVDEDLRRMSNVSKFYDVFKITGTPSTPQFIFNSFVAYADSVLERQEYLNALNLIRNANEIGTFFKSVKSSESYSTVYSDALNGLLTSFLKVSIMAYKSRNFKIAKRYYMQAQEIYNENAGLISNNYAAKNSFKEFIDSQIALADMFLSDRYYEDAILILDQTRDIGLKNELLLDGIDFNSAYEKAYKGIYSQLVDSIEYYIAKENSSNSLSALISSANFEQTHSNYLKRDERVSLYAQVLIDDLVKKGIEGLKGRSPEIAMDYLLDARNLNKSFQLNNTQLIDSAISKAAIPIAMQLINKASFEVWANRLDEANRLKKEAEEHIEKYGLETNLEAQNALLQLQEKINNRACIGLQYKVDHTVKISLNRIKSGKFREAQLSIEKAYTLIDELEICEIDKSGLDGISAKYSALFDFINSYEVLNSMLETSSFTEIRLQYEALVGYYDHQKLGQYIEGLPDLIQLLKESKQLPMYFEAIEYYIDQKKFEVAFDYLDMLRLSGIPAKNTKDYQKAIGYSICKEKQDKEAFIKRLTNDNSWFGVLQKECMRN